MSRLRIVPIVEGHGENQAIRILLQRIWTELLQGEYVEVIQPIRGNRLGEALPEAPERSRQGKAWILRRRPRYKPRIDQPRLTEAMDLVLCRKRSPSFAKLCRELEARLQQTS